MARRPRPALVGVFVLGAAALIVVAVAVWGSDRLFERNYRYACFFTGSVHGLEIGAPVKFRGVTVGSVIDIRIAFSPSLDRPRVPVIIELLGRRLRGRGATRDPEPHVVAELVERGLRAQLQIQSLVTGQLYVALDLFPDIDKAPPHPGARYPEIPTVPTTFEEASRTLASLLAEVQKADIAGAARSLAQVIDGVNQLVNQPAMAKTIAGLPSMITAVRQLAIVLHGDVGAITGSLERTLAEVRQGLDGVRALTAPRGGLAVELERTLGEVQRAAGAVRALAEFLQRNPNALVVGKKRQ